jgi:predicted ATPase/DNA-binding CsgD family transcriptional regulator
MTDKLSTPLDKFKERELEIINLMADGLSNKEIADNLFITKETVRWYNKQIYSKLGTSRRTEAIALAREMGLIDTAISQPDISQTKQHQLPITTGPFIGRDDELNELSEILGNPDVRLVSIIATGGMGKSRLSLELGHRIKSHYEQEAAFIDLSPIRNPDDVAKYTVTSLGITITDNQDPYDVLSNYCREKELLLIFDNFEHVLSGAPLLSDILEVAPKITIIATSRERLNLRVETVYALTPIIQGGVELFLEVATMMRPSIVITEDDYDDISQIVQLVGGLPLGLVLASTWVDVMSIAEIADEIKSNLDFLSSDMGDMPERQRSIHAVINPTWNRLNDKEQRAFMWASVFRGGFTRQLFQQLTGTSARILQTLLSRSLISHRHERRYDLHPLLRQYAREKLEAHEMTSQAKQAHLGTFLQYAKHQAEQMYSGYYIESLESLDIEQDNFRAVLDWSLEGNEIEDGIALILSLCNFWHIQSLAVEAIYYLEQAVKHKQEANLYERLASFQDRLGKRDSANANIQIAITLAVEANQQDILARAYRLKGNFLASTDSEEAFSLYQQALAINRDLKLTHEVAHCYVGLGLAILESKSHESLDYFQKAEAIYEELGDLRGISMVIYNMALAYQSEGDRQRAKMYCERSLSIKKQIGDKAGAARRLAVLAHWDINDEEFEQAISSLTESRAICEDIGEQPRLVYTLAIEGILRLIMTEYGQAKVIFERGLEIALAISDHKYVEAFYSNLALLYLLQEQPEYAKPYVMQALQAHKKITTFSWLCIVAYVNYLWYMGQIDSCLSIAAITIHHLDHDDLHNKYFLQPLYYRIQKQIGEAAWKKAVDEAEGITIEQLFQNIIETTKYN